MVAALAACGGGPETVPAALHAALAAGDDAVVDALLTARSRPIVAALRAVDSANHFGLGGMNGGAKAPEVTAGRATEQGMTLQVRAAGVEREWLVVREGGRWRLDLLGTAARRSWNDLSL